MKSDQDCQMTMLYPSLIFRKQATYNNIAAKQILMGMFYSFISYLYPSANIKLNEHNIKTKCQKLIIRIKNIQYKLQQEAYKQEKDLLAQIMQKTTIRSKEGEKVRMDMVIQNSEKLLVYDQVIYCLNKIIAEAYVLEYSPQNMSNECLLSISSVIYVYNPLELNEFVKLNEFIPEPFPNIDVSKIRPLLQKYLKKPVISDYERNLYALQFCNRHNLTLDFLNSAGHNFVTHPIEQSYETPSSQMFAITLQQMKVEQQNQL